MTEFAITPHVGAGPVRFGMTMSEARSAVGQPVRQFLKDPNDEFPTDAFDTEELHVCYKAPGVCDAVEFGSSARLTLNHPRSANEGMSTDLTRVSG